MKKYVRPKRTFRHRKRFRRRRPSMNRMQRAAYSYVKKKYTLVLPLTCRESTDSVSLTVSHLGGLNSTTPQNTVSLAKVNPDDMALMDMKAYQFFKITGVGFKLYFPEGTSPLATPVQWSMGYSASKVLNPNLAFGPLQSLATFQSSSCSAARPVRRYFKTATTLKRLGIEWCNTTEYPDFDLGIPQPLYGDQLPPDAGSSTLLRVYRSSSNVDTNEEIARVQVTYYVQYKGAKGQS